MHFLFIRDIIRKIKSFHSKPADEVGESRHYKNIKKGKCVVIDGKEYVKVKLRLVDTLNFDTSKHIDNLETEVQMLRAEVSRLHELQSYSEEQITLLNTLNTNLLSSENSQSAILRKKISTLQNLRSKDMLFARKLNNLLEKRNTQIEKLRKKIEKLELTIKSRNSEIVKLDRYLSSLKPDAHLENSKQRKDRLSKQVTGLLKETESLNTKLKEKDLLISTLTNQIFEKEMKINALEAKKEKP